MNYNYRLASEVRFNWFYSTEVGEEYQKYVVNGNTVEEIDYHAPDSYDSTHYCDIKFTNGEVHRVFNINYVKLL